MSWHEARTISLSVAPPHASERVPLAVAHGRVLASALLALSELPHYSSSAMDGWAVAGSPPWRIVDRASLEGGDCRPIVTGGAIPAGAFAVLRSEHASLDAEGRLVPAADARPDEPRPGEHIRYSGEEARSGEVLIAAGTMLNPAHVALAASAGHDELDVQGRPRVRLLFTGDEVVLRGIPGPGFVRDSFGPML
ncbi:MAG TPA: molybdopterin molybdenumtransferase MoeA, partial [Galbitalea sp.]